MLSFYSASARIVNSRRAIADCLESALAEANAYLDCRVIIIYAGLGHDYEAMMDEAKTICPNAQIFGGSGCAVIGPEGVTETLKCCAIMAICGPESEICCAYTPLVTGETSLACATKMAQELKEKAPNINMIKIMASGIDIACDQLILGIESVFGNHIPIFGATSSDVMQGKINYQMLDGQTTEHGAFMVGFADPTLEVITQATHGFFALGEPMTVTKSDGNKIHELNGKPAWPIYADRLGLCPDTATLGDSIPIGAMAEALPPDDAKAYRNPHILRVITHKNDDGTLYYPCFCPEGTKLWLTTRDEEAIFRDLELMVSDIIKTAENKKLVAVFHADCLARGRAVFGQIFKDEIVNLMQAPFRSDTEPLQWLGIYGFGEFAKLNGENQFHNYTTALYTIYRK